MHRTNILLVNNIIQYIERFCSIGVFMKLHVAIAQRTQNLLAEKSLKPYALYKNGGIARSTISTLLSANIKNVSSDLIYQICSTLEISLKEFFDDRIFDNIDD